MCIRDRYQRRVHGGLISNMQLNDSVQRIEARIKALETAVGLEKLKRINEDLANQQTLKERLTKMEEKLKALPPSYVNFVNKLEKVDLFMKNSQSNLDFLLTSSTKGKIITLVYHDLMNFFQEIEKIKESKKHLDFPPIYELDQKILTLNQVEAVTNENSQLTMEQNEKINELIRVNNEIIEDLNKKFIYYESILAGLEEKRKKQNRVNDSVVFICINMGSAIGQ
eukprot:TRINITY_DN1391_c0_g1_i12.p1 TRINITY_DN1391_c0_g1~~TRINITY_DN1391_c0_g1_i12.p1  ORF type:complete len:225 (-),score=68.81 TRINITY_DN1391_c0_g1_i12:235-909(-)